MGTVVTCMACDGTVYKGRKSNYIKVFGGYRHEDATLCALIRELTRNPVTLDQLLNSEYGENK